MVRRAPSSRRVAFDVFDLVRLRDGKVVEHWNVVDIADLMLGRRPDRLVER